MRMHGVCASTVCIRCVRTFTALRCVHPLHACTHTRTCVSGCVDGWVGLDWLQATIEELLFAAIGWDADEEIEIIEAQKIPLINH